MKAEKAKYTRESNPVADMMNWNEVIKKEVKNSKIYDKFNIYPTSSKHSFCKYSTCIALKFFSNAFLVKILSEKPTQRKWKKDDEEESEVNEADQIFECKPLSNCPTKYSNFIF